ncbi:MAG: hypothetical protein Q4C55_08585 [Eubacterium sp.]|nr:hypothetical protein [Eubacterium sp.]
MESTAKIYAYPARFTLHAEREMSFCFPDFHSPERHLTPEEMPQLIDVAADALGALLNEYLLLGKALPEATPLEALDLNENQKGLWIQIAEA